MKGLTLFSWFCSVLFVLSAHHASAFDIACTQGSGAKGEMQAAPGNTAGQSGRGSDQSVSNGAVSVVGAKPLPPVSHISVPITLTLAPLVQEIEKAVPQGIDHSTHWEAREGASVKYKVWRDPLHVSFEGNRLLIEGRLYYNLQIAAKVLGKYVRLGSCGVDEPPRQALVKMESVIDCTQDWRLSSQTTVSRMDFPNRCEVSILKFDITDLIRSLFVARVQEAARKFDVEIAHIAFRNYAEQAWRTLQSPIALGYENAWLVIAPAEVSLAPLRGTGDTVTIALAITGHPQIQVGEKPASGDSPLPKLTASTATDGFHLVVAGELSFDAVASLLKKEFEKPSLSSGNNSIRIEEVQVSGQGDVVTLAIRTTGAFTGTLYAKGRLVYDPDSATATLTDLSYSIETRNALAKLIAEQKLNQWLVQWQGKAHWSLAGPIKDAKTRITMGLNRTLQPGVVLSGRITALQPLAITTTPTGFTIPIAVDGVTSIAVKP